MNATTLREFKREYPEHKDITIGQFGVIITQFNKNILEEVSTSRNGISLPEWIGQLLVMSFPRGKRRAIDFKESNRTGVKTYIRNWDTDDRMCKIVYHTGKHSIRYSNLWGFTATKGFKTKVSQVYKKLWAKYIYLDDTSVSISSVLK